MERGEGMRVLMIDDDNDFRKRFSGYIAACCRDVSITACGEDSEYETMLQSADIIIADDSVSEKARSIISDSDCDIVFLTDTNLLQNAESHDLHGSNDYSADYTDMDKYGILAKDIKHKRIRYVFKYQSAAMIIKSIPSLWELRTETQEAAVSGEKLTIACVTGFSGGSGKTSFSLIAARLVKEKTHKGVLLIGTDCISDISDYFYGSSTESSSDMNLLLLNYASSISAEISDFLITDRYGVSCIRNPSDGISDFSSLSADDTEGFLKYINSWNLFGTVIFDMDHSSNERNRSILKNADVIFVMCDSRRPIFNEGSAEDKWMKTLYDSGGKSKIIRINNFDISSDSLSGVSNYDEFFKNEEITEYRLPMEKKGIMKNDYHYDINMSGRFAAAAGDLIRRTAVF